MSMMLRCPNGQACARPCGCAVGHCLAATLATSAVGFYVRGESRLAAIARNMEHLRQYEQAEHIGNRVRALGKGS